MKAPLESFFGHLRAYLSSLHHRTELLESLEWDEEALEALLSSTFAEMSRLLEHASEDEKETTIVLIALREGLKGAAASNQIDIVMELLQAEAAQFFVCGEENECD